ncbi:EcsC family protein [Saccharothrix sp. S26]|uniref:EcsC family protein n=1 Tax=Saccharothrix sp. S26 TaxID=2907215 RepID=UPI001F319F50|nr:EcsC family protein [Saccharothrix sp. S26]MCE6997618.1 EcsC family protein [Saccharothrix sp. S26]
MVDEPGAITRVQQNAVDHLLKVGINGFGPFKGARQMAAEALDKGLTPEEAIKHLIRTHVAAAGVQGFATNIGGLITLPVTLPANLTASYLVQTHLIASIAAVHGHDLDSDEVQTAILVCLLGNAGTEVLKKAGIKVGAKLTMNLIERIPAQLIREINKRVGFTLLAKYGTTKATVTLAKGVPIVGGVIGGTFDAVTTRAVGAFAARFFTEREELPAVVEGTVIEGEVVDVSD